MTETQAQDEKFMRAAIDEARKALLAKEVPVGAVVVLGDKIIGRAHNLVETLGDPTAHAEMQAITSATNWLGGKYLWDCTIYVTVEPCTMCAGAIAWAQLGRVVFGASDPKKGFLRFAGGVLHPKTVVNHGVLEDECAALMTGFFGTLRN